MDRVLQSVYTAGCSRAHMGNMRTTTTSRVLSFSHYLPRETTTRHSPTFEEE